MQNNQPNQEVDFDALVLTPFQSKHTSRVAGGPSSMTMVNTPNNGKRISISGEVLKKIGATETVELASYRDGIAIGRELPGVNASRFVLKKSGKDGSKEGVRKSMVYCGGLVKELTELFELDFSGGRTSISFEEVMYQDKSGLTIAFVPLRHSSPADAEAESEQSEQNDSDEEEDELFE